MGTFLSLVGFCALVIALIGLVRGRVGWARISSRRGAGGVAIGAFAVMLTGGALSPSSGTTTVTDQQAAPSIDNTSTSTSVSSSAPAAVAAAVSSAAPSTRSAAPTRSSVTASPSLHAAVVTPRRTAAATTHATVRVTHRVSPTVVVTHRPSHAVVVTHRPSPTVAATHRTTAPPAVAVTCQASMTNVHPSHNERTDVIVRTVAGASVATTAHYKTTDTSHTGVASGSGVADIAYRISRATYGYPVEVDVSVTLHGQNGQCSTSFTPEP